MRIFFDVDGVLINNLHAVRGWIKRWDENIEKDLGIKQDHFQEIFKSWFPDVLCGRLDLEEELERWLKRNDYDVKAWQILNYWHERDSNLNTPVWEVIDSLSSNSDVALYLATNQSHARAHHLWHAMEFKNRFREIYYSARLGTVKRSHDYFRQIEKELEFDPRAEPPLYFDDDPKNIETAAARGWNAVLFDTAEDCVRHPAIRSLLVS